MQEQVVKYEFEVYSLPMPADVPVTILTPGKSLLRAAVDLELPLNTTGKHRPLAWVIHLCFPGSLLRCIGMARQLGCTSKRRCKARHDARTCELHVYISILVTVFYKLHVFDAKL